MATSDVVQVFGIVVALVVYDLHRWDLMDLRSLTMSMAHGTRPWNQVVVGAAVRDVCPPAWEGPVNILEGGEGCFRAEQGEFPGQVGGEACLLVGEGEVRASEEVRGVGLQAVEGSVVAVDTAVIAMRVTTRGLGDAMDVAFLLVVVQVVERLTAAGLDMAPTTSMVVGALFPT